MEISVAGNNDLSESATRAQVHRGNSDLLGVLRDDWLRLCVSGGCNTPYNRPEFFTTYMWAFQPNSKIIVDTVRDEGSLMGILPLVKAREIWYGIRGYQFNTAAACPRNSFAKSTHWNGKARNESLSAPTRPNFARCRENCPVARLNLAVKRRSDRA